MPSAASPPRRALVAGWFSYEQSDYTAGDLLACDLVCEWLAEAGYVSDVAHHHATAATAGASAGPPDRPGGGVHVPAAGPRLVDLGRVDAADYALAVFVCGPFMQNHWERDFLAKFAGIPRVGVNLTLPVPLAEWNPFTLILERDSSERAHPDITFLARHTLVPVVGVCRVEPYPPARVDLADAAIERLLAAREAARVPIDTRLDVNATGLRTKAEVESLLARMDVVVTTRLHGTVLALKHGVPVVAIDPEPGGAKILRQARTIGWPVAFAVDALDDGALARAFDYCLTGAARAAAARCRDRAVAAVEQLRTQFVEALRSGGVGPR